MGVGRMGRSPTLGPRRGSKQVNSRRQDHFSTFSPHSFLSLLHVPHTCTNVRRTSQGKIGREREIGSLLVLPLSPPFSCQGQSSSK